MAATSPLLGVYMANESLRWSGVLVRLVAAIVLVYVTFNPEGYSYYDWAIAPLFRSSPSFSAAKFLSGAVLLAAWVVFLQATGRSIGWKGALLVAAICGGLVWLLIDLHVVNAGSSRLLVHLGLVAVSTVLAVGMAWSHVSRRMTGQVDTDSVG
jgi:hypothetical protein